MWHTPKTPTGGDVNPDYMSQTGRLPDGKKRTVGLSHQAKMVERGLWPTPNKADGTGGPGNSGRQGGENLRTAVKFPTPRAQDGDKMGRGSLSDNWSNESPHLSAETSGQLNPAWVAWLMGWPINWTSLAPLPDADFIQWLDGMGSGEWWRDEPDIPRIATGVSDRKHRLMALGNGQVPATSAMAWDLLTGEL